MTYKYFTKIADGILTQPVLDEIQEPQWMEDTFLRDYPQGPFKAVESIMLRFPPIGVRQMEESVAEYHSKIDQHENNWRPESKLHPVAKNLALGIMKAVNGTRLGRVMINKVNPGGIIYRHADTPDHAQYWSRFHVVLQSEAGSDFFCGPNSDGFDDESMNMQTGEVWYFRNDLYHEVRNNSNTPRIHMIVDVRTEDDFYKAPVAITYPEGISFRVEKLKDVIEELKPFAPIHWAELGLDQKDVPLDMDWDRYLDMDENNTLQLVIARDSGKVIGYQFTLIGTHLHYKTTLHGSVDLYFLLEKYRKGRTGIKLLKFAMQKMKERGVVKIIQGTKLHKDHSRIFEYLGFKNTDSVFTKVIK